MDPLYASSVLSSASRQVTDPAWPAAPQDREMTAWSPAPEGSSLPVAGSVLRPLRAITNRLRVLLRRPATSTAG